MLLLILPTMPVPFAKLVGIERTGAGTGRCADRRAFAFAGDCADARARGRRPGHCQLVTMFLPESPTVTTTMTSGLPRRNRPYCEGERQHNQKNR